MAKKLLVLDLDNTLIFSEAGGEGIPIFEYGMKIRPFMDEFLEYIFTHFHVAVWTASGERYAQKVISHVFGMYERSLSFVYTSKECTRKKDMEFQQEFLVKKRQKIRFPKEDVIVIDDSFQAWSSSYGNLVLVPSWEGDPSDTVLKELVSYLDTLKEVQNVRTIEKRTWRKCDKVQSDI